MPAKDRNESGDLYIERLVRDIINYISNDVRRVLLKVDRGGLASAEEIRLRALKPLMMLNCHGDWFVSPDGRLVSDVRDAFIVEQNEIMKTLELMSENSIYAYQDEIRNGFITLKGGHRVGISGKTILDGCSVKNIKDISGLNIRLSREVRGCAEKVAGYLLKNRTEIYNTLIISPPQCGKTTLLRDIARIISDGMPEACFQGVKVGVVDERSEIASCHKGIPQNYLGMRTDVLDSCPKSIGMTMLLRSMSPQVIITDEIGNKGDKDAIMQVINAGVKIVATAHGYNISELKTRREVLELMEDRVFERYVVLSSKRGPGTVEEIVDGSTMQQLKLPVGG